MKISQNELVKNHLESGQPINPLLAFEKYNILRLGARIFNLREEGMEIRKTMHYKGRKRWAEYTLVK